MLFASIDAGLKVGLTSAPQAIQVDFDSTFLVQLVLFVALTLVLKPLLFDPMLKLFEERERRIDGVKAEARRVDQRSADALSKYEAEITKARASANAEREGLRAEGVKKEQAILANVRETTARLIEEGKRTAKADADRVRSTLRAQTEGLSRETAKRVLGREVPS